MLWFVWLQASVLISLLTVLNSLSSTLMRRRVAVIGGGPAGLVTSKQLADTGVAAKIFTNHIGGMWNAKRSPFWPAMKTNLSRFTCRFSDQLWPEKAPMFPNQQEMHDNLSAYAAKHIEPCNIVTECTVTSLKRDERGQYLLTWQDATQQSNSELFDDVVIASGFFSKRVLSGDWKDFTGRVLHSSEYTSPDSFVGRRVAVVGSSFSSAEVAADVASVASTVYSVLPRPAWMIPRYLPERPDKPNTAFLPVDLLFYQLRRNQDGDGRKEVLFKNDADRAKSNAYLQALLGGEREDPLREVGTMLHAAL
jgi:cation diffusion facilitator CzcD-associated flavoprotein CzcO